MCILSNNGNLETKKRIGLVWGSYVPRDLKLSWVSLWLVVGPFPWGCASFTMAPIVDVRVDGPLPTPYDLVRTEIRVGCLAGRAAACSAPLSAERGNRPPGVSTPERLEEVAGPESKAVCHALDGAEPGVAVTLLNLAELGAADAQLQGKLRLRQAELRAPPPDVSPEYPRQFVHGARLPDEAPDSRSNMPLHLIFRK